MLFRSPPPCGPKPCSPPPHMALKPVSPHVPVAAQVLVNSQYTRGMFGSTFTRLDARGLRPDVLYPAVVIPTDRVNTHACTSALNPAPTPCPKPWSYKLNPHLPAPMHMFQRETSSAHRDL